MGEALFQVVIIAVGVWGVIRGARRGFMTQLGPLLALGLALVTAIVCREYVEPQLPGLPKLPWDAGARSYVRMAAATSVVFLPALVFFEGVCYPLSRLAASFGVGVVGRISGAVVCLARYLVVVSAVYNMIVAIDPETPIVDAASHDDGNLVQLVMPIAPAIMDYDDIDEFLHRRQLYEATQLEKMWVNP